MMQVLNCARDKGDIEAVKTLLQRLESNMAYVLASD